MGELGEGAGLADLDLGAEEVRRLDGARGRGEGGDQPTTIGAPRSSRGQAPA
jgi:hypothetical protein